MKALSVILAVLGFVALVALTLVGADANFMQLVGNIAGEVPIVGVWYNALSGLNREMLTGGFTQAANQVLGLAILCVTSNILDSFFLGFVFSFLKRLVGLFIDGVWSNKLNLGTTVVASIVGVLILWLIKRGDEATQALVVTLTDLALLGLGVTIMLRGSNAVLNVAVFLYDAAVGAVEAGGGIGLLCSVILLPSMIRNGISLGWYLGWLLCLVLLILVMRLVNISRSLAGAGKYL